MKDEEAIYSKVLTYSSCHGNTQPPPTTTSRTQNYVGRHNFPHVWRSCRTERREGQNSFEKSQVGLGMLLISIVFLKNTGACMWFVGSETITIIFRQQSIYAIYSKYTKINLSIWDRSIVPCFPRPCWSHRWLRAMEAKLPELANWAKCLNQEDGYGRFVCSLGGKFSWNLGAAGTADACLSLLFFSG